MQNAAMGSRTPRCGPVGGVVVYTAVILTLTLGQRYSSQIWCSVSAYLPAYRLPEPRSSSTSQSTAVSVPSRLAPSFIPTSAAYRRGWLKNSSGRVSSSFTGRPAIMARRAA